MSSSVKLGIGYTLLVIGGILLVAGAVAQGTEAGNDDCKITATGTDCDGYKTGVSPLALYFPGIAFVLAGLPLAIFGHIGKRDERQRQAQVPAAPSAPRQ